MEEVTKITETETEEAASELATSTEQADTELETEAVQETSELLDEEPEQTTEAIMLVEVDNTAEVELLTQIAGDVRVILVFTILTYCSACMRRWRNATIKGGR